MHAPILAGGWTNRMLSAPQAVVLAAMGLIAALNVIFCPLPFLHPGPDERVAPDDAPQVEAYHAETSWPDAYQVDVYDPAVCESASYDAERRVWEAVIAPDDALGPRWEPRAALDAWSVCAPR